VPGKGHADMVWASAFACGGDLLLRLAGGQGKDLIAEAQRASLVANRFCTLVRGRSRDRVGVAAFVDVVGVLAEAVFLGPVPLL
jgi:hypothetical protein